MKEWKKILLKPDSTIKEALEVIENGSVKIGLVVDLDDKLIGTLTDGDIRRGLLKKLSLEDSIESITSNHPTVCFLNDTREEILQIAIEKKLLQVPIVDNKGVLVGLEIVDELLKPKKRENQVILMVGGLGKRLKPLTDSTPKPMLKVGDKPILETIILNFKKYGFTNIILCVSYKSDIIKDHFGDGSNFGVKIEYIREKKRMGTAGALSLIKSKILNDSFFVMNGDLLTNVNFEDMMDFHITNKSVATMGVREYDLQVPYGVVNVEGSNITAIEEKPIHSFFVSAGIYILKKDVLKYIPDETFFDMPTLFEKVIDNSMKSSPYPIREYWLDIGRIEEFDKANNEYHKVF